MSRKCASIGCFVFLFACLCLALASCKSKTADSGSGAPRDQAIRFLSEGKYEEAAGAFENAIDADPANLTNYIDLSLLLLSQGKYDEVVKQVKAGLKIQNQNIDLRLILAEAFFQKGFRADATKEWNEVLKLDAKNASAFYKLSKLAEADQQTAAQKSWLLNLVSVSPANIVARLKLAELLAKEGKSDSSLFYLQSVKKISPGFSQNLDSVYKRANDLLAANRSAEAVSAISQFSKRMEISQAYASSLQEVDKPGVLTGFSEFADSRFTQSDRQINKTVSLDDIRFTDASANLGLNIQGMTHAAHSTVAISEEAEGGSFLYTSYFITGNAGSQYHFFKIENGNFQDLTGTAGIKHEGEEWDAAFADYDNDGFQDLFILTTKGIILYRNRGDGSFTQVSNAGLNEIADGRKLLIADFDQDGDLDLYVAGISANHFFRNNNDGTFSEQAQVMNLLADVSGTRDFDFGDWDNDGDLDIAAVAGNGSVGLLDNKRRSKFVNLADSLRLNSPTLKGNAIAVGDYNNDGLPDLFLGGAGENSFLLKNTGTSGFVVDPVSTQLSNALKNVSVNEVAFLDFDNDGREDILVAGTPKAGATNGVQLFHNDSTKGFSNASRLLPPSITQASRIRITDFNLDGDDDIFLSGSDGVWLLRNDGGNQNHYVQLQLSGIAFGNNKNNRIGIGAQVELKAGELYQLKTIKRAYTNFGVGGRDSIDAVRIIWPNGTPQWIGDPTSRQKLLEEEKLKGSCPFLYAWNGKRYEFVKDMMWRSVLGMPLAYHGKDTVYAFSDPSKEYLLIPGEKLQPRDGKYELKITEELWEAVYFDKAGLTAVDHPDSVKVFADERFVSPPFPGKTVHPVSHAYYPVSAKDEKGTDLLQKISAYDFQFISNFSPGKFQGIAQSHELILDLGNDAIADSLLLFLRGWTFPSDASISTSNAQSDANRIQFPSLDVINAKGEWQTVISNIGFPMGKDKMVIINLSGKFLSTHDRRVRISTNMQIYWDEIFFSRGHTKATVNMHDLPLSKATLAFRGYSETFRKGGPFGPHWFDYYQTSAGQKWRDLTGSYTRYGDVKPLLLQADDEYIIVNSGDEITIEFDPAQLPALPKGWKRDFLVYSEGWVKDGDLNTVYGQTVEPLPFHGMPSYPYGGSTVYPRGQHQRYLKAYNTREVSTEDFRNAVRGHK